jgi:AraC family transcriptional regulator, ethanolamine operon transcriptional activator
MQALRAGDADPASIPLLHVGSFACDEPWVTEQATVPWDNAITPLSRGPYRHENTFLATSRLILYRETFSVWTRVQGLSPPDMFSFAVPLRLGSKTHWWGKALHERGLPAAMPGGVHVEISPGQQHFIALVDLGLMHDSMPEELCVAIEKATCGHVLPAARSAVGRLAATFSALLDGATAHPQALRHPNAVRCMEQDLLAAFGRSLTGPLPAPRGIGRAIRQRGLQRAIEYLRAMDPGAVTVADLCTAACVTERTLQYAFRETFGLSPLGFLHLRRYHATRRDLLAADAKAATVNEIAQRNGFYEMGRFAVRYKALFGESPSATLHRHCDSMPRGILRPADFGSREI